MNRVILLGRIGKIENKGNFTKVSLVTTSRVKGEEVVQWHDCLAFGKTAETIEKYMEKGCQIGVEGSISYNLKDKVKYTNILIERLDILSWKKNQGNEDMGQVPQFDTDDEIPF